MDAIDFKKEIVQMRDVKGHKAIRVAVLSSYTIQNIELPLTHYLLTFGFNPEIKYGGYQQFNQELRDPSSWLKEWSPDIVFIATSTKTIFPHLEYDIVTKGYAQTVQNCKNTIEALIESISQYGGSAKIILTSFENIQFSPFGFKDFTAEDGLHALVQQCNDLLREYARKNAGCILLDFERIAGIVGREHLTDDKMYYLGKLFLTNAAAQHLALEVATCINASYGKIKKCIVVDLDNTLWSGVIGEDGPKGIVLGDDSPIGSIYSDIQRTLLNYKTHGVLLAIVTKNNEADVLPVFDEPAMVLKKEDFIIIKSNWKPKSLNIQEIAEELNLGVDHFMFLDDNPAERLEVASALPSMQIIDFPSDVAKLPKLLKSLPQLKTIALTDEDKKRNELYQQERSRSELAKKLPVEDYLKELQITISVKKNDLDSLERITQLINKTNQFNLRTQRYTQEQVRAMMTDSNAAVFSLRAADKFGDMGLAAVAILKIDDKTHETQNHGSYFIDTLLMSCRILARGIEKQFFYEILKMLSQATELHAEYLPTPKNDLVKEFYETLLFVVTKATPEGKSYHLALDGYDRKEVEWIKVISGE